MKKPFIGVICTPHGNQTEKHLFAALGEKFDVVLFPLQKDTDYEELKRQAKNIRIVINTAMDMPNTYDSLEMVKTFEDMGKRVIDSSKSFYYHEDKWGFFLTCRRNKLPTPTTYYIPRDIKKSRDKLKKIMSEGPVVFKGIFSDTGRAVKRAMTYKDALRVISSLRKTIQVMPLIAQRYVPHGNVSYRVTMTGDKIIQGIIKYGKNWKEGKLFWKNEYYKVFEPDKQLAKLCKKTASAFGIEWCGIDLMKDSAGNWLLIEVNSCPSMDFVISDMERANGELVDYIYRLNSRIGRKK